MTKPENKILTLPAKGMDLQTTLFCGQTFSWQLAEDTLYVGVAGNRAVYASLEKDLLQLTNTDETPFTQEDTAFWNHYFAVDINYPALTAKFCTHTKLAQCVSYAPGVRVLRQPFFDTLLCFIISQNNHIPRITSIASRLREEYGPLLPGGQRAYPTAETLAQLELEDLACLRAGFRGKYLLDAARKVASGLVSEQEINSLPDDQAREKLMQIYGVGTKVADCVLLYSFGRNRIVPMDVWMKRAIEQQFKGKMPAVAKGYEGIAQQFIFFWARENLVKGEAKPPKK